MFISLQYNKRDMLWEDIRFNQLLSANGGLVCKYQRFIVVKKLLTQGGCSALRAQLGAPDGHANVDLFVGGLRHQALLPLPLTEGHVLPEALRCPGLPPWSETLRPLVVQPLDSQPPAILDIAAWWPAANLVQIAPPEHESGSWRRTFAAQVLALSKHSPDREGVVHLCNGYKCLLPTWPVTKDEEAEDEQTDDEPSAAREKELQVLVLCRVPKPGGIWEGFLRVCATKGLFIIARRDVLDAGSVIRKRYGSRPRLYPSPFAFFDDPLHIDNPPVLLDGTS
jgi:hypothetical protein